MLGRDGRLGTIHGDGPGKWNSALAQDSGTRAAPGSADSAIGLDGDGDRDTAPAARVGRDRNVEDAESAVLPDWPLNANNVNGTSDPEDMRHSQ
ncbi:MAG TPA: hypothetical protein VF460_13505 [Burkholderiales bacterium]